MITVLLVPILGGKDKLGPEITLLGRFVRRCSLGLESRPEEHVLGGRTRQSG